MSHQSVLLPLHGQLLAGDIRAAHRIVEIAIQPLIAIVGRDVQMSDPHDVEQACMDALLRYLQAPNLYDPGRSQLLTYLAAIAKGLAMTIQRSNSRRLIRETKYRTILDQAGDAGMAFADVDLRDLRPDQQSQLVKEAGDGQILELIAKGENALSEVARILNLPATEQGIAEAGKRLERMRGRLRRLKDKTGA
jgi:RNA polymerase sigma-70 factor (ECF subfamily)